MNEEQTEAAILARLNRFRDATVGAFEEHVTVAIKKAEEKTVRMIMTNLSMKDGVVADTQKNREIIHNVDNFFILQLKDTGLNGIINAFSSEGLIGQLPFLDETLAMLTSQLKNPLPKLKWTASDIIALQSVRKTTVSAIKDAIRMQAEKTATRILFGAASLKTADVVKIIQDGLGVSARSATTLAATSQSAFYRVASSKQYDKIQAGQREELRYRYSGPIDNRERPFCAHMSAMSVAGKSWTKDQFNAMDNGINSLKPVWVFLGGIGCRHTAVPVNLGLFGR